MIEFLVAILAGLPHLEDISRDGHPLDQDSAVALAWQQPGWADYSGVSRTIQGLSMDEAHAIGAVLDTVSQPFIDAAVVAAIDTQGGLVYDGHLTGRSVSPTSTTYPGAAYGHMDDSVQLGYQAAVVSLSSPGAGRVWLTVQPHPGNTVSSTQVASMVAAAEQRICVRPLRRTELLAQQLLTVTEQRQVDRQQQVVTTAQQRVDRQCALVATVRSSVAALQQRLERFTQENTANCAPVHAVFRLDAGFGSGDNIALLLELGYELYTKPLQDGDASKYGVTDATTWTVVGDNAEMVAWSDQHLRTCPYPLDVALERFHTGKTIRHSLPVHFGQDRVTEDLSAWFGTYNDRQTIEAGIKVGKPVF